MIKRILKILELDDDQWVPEKVRWQINTWKDDALRPKDIDDKGDLRIIGIGNEPCNGLNKGIISEIDATVSSIRRAKDKASSMSTCNIQSVTTGIAGNHIQSYNGNGAVNILNDEVTTEDKEKVLNNAQNI